MLTPDELYHEDDLLDRIEYVSQQFQKSILLLTGSGISLGSSTKPGIPSTKEVLALIENELKIDVSATKLHEVGNAYRSGFKNLIGRRGQSGANSIIQKAVLQALRPEHRTNHNLDSNACESLERNPNAWEIPVAHAAIARLFRSNASPFKPTILTSNFDPLHEVALSGESLPFRTSVLDRDGNPNQSLGPGIHVVHFHGYWRGSDTLHTDRQLSQSRPNLKSAIAQFARNSTILVVGYGGWDDIVTNTLSELAGDPAWGIELLWCFFNADKQELLASNASIIEKFSSPIGQGRAQFYCGIDCNTFFPRLLDRLPGTHTPARQAIETVQVRIDELWVEDHPPDVTAFVGRGKELSKLASTEASLVFISGVGGQGKSTLSAKHYAIQRETKKVFSNFAWFDLREEGDSLSSKLKNSIEKFSLGTISLATLAASTNKDVVSIFLKVISRQSCLVIFDNVDHYIDFESFEPTGLLQNLLEMFGGIQSSSRLIVTCRPQVRHHDVHVEHIHLQDGLDLQATEELFRIEGVKDYSSTDLARAHAATEGHPLWLTFIARQCGRACSSISVMLDEIEKGEGELPARTFRVISSSLNEDQRKLLSAIAALPRPLQENSLSDLVSEDLNFNRFSKSLKVLKRLNFLMLRSADGGPLIDLHPLVRYHVRREFNSKERQSEGSLVSNLIRLIERKILPAKKSSSHTDMPREILELWLLESEALIADRRFVDAVSPLNEAYNALAVGGLGDEFCRLSRKCLDGIPDWQSKLQESKDFAALLSRFIESLIHSEEFDDAAEIIDRYEGSVPGRSSHYVNVCHLRSELYRVQERWQEAIDWGRRGKDLVEHSGADTQHSSTHNWALSEREAGNREHALSYFLEGHPLEDVLDSSFKKTTASPGVFWGNIGRCLQLMGREEQALLLLRRSLNEIRNARDRSRTTEQNRGYAHFWIGSALAASGHIELAFHFLRVGREYWDRVSPALSGQINRAIVEQTRAHPEIARSVMQKAIKESTRACQRWADSITNTSSVSVSRL